MTKQLESRISSREVSEMMDMLHKDLLKKIDSINTDFGSEKVRHEKYWVEGTFENRGKEYREFQITKRGCEFLAHKTTGTKGNLFTDKYMDRFAQMEQVIKSNVLPVKTDELKAQELEARLRNARAREANILLKIANNQNLPKEYIQILQSKASAIVNNGEALIPLPKLEKKTYSAVEIGKELGISANMVGRLANSNNLKTEEFGMWVMDKSRHSSKEVQSFRYYDTVINKIREFLV